MSKHTANVKTLQREVQTTELELGSFLIFPPLISRFDRLKRGDMYTEQFEKDIEALSIEMKEAQATLAKARIDLVDFVERTAVAEGKLTVVETKILQETKRLTAFKDELDELDRAMKVKRQEIADGQGRSKELSQEIETIKKGQKGAIEAVNKLEKQYTWIADEHQCVSDSIFVPTCRRSELTAFDFLIQNVWQRRITV